MDQFRTRRAVYVKRARERNYFSSQVRTLALSKTLQLSTDVLNIIESFVRVPQSLLQMLRDPVYWGPDRFIREPWIIEQSRFALKRKAAESAKPRNTRAFFRLI